MRIVRGKRSIVHDVKLTINLIDKIGQSKKAARDNNNQGIHSLKQKKRNGIYLSKFCEVGSSRI